MAILIHRLIGEDLNIANAIEAGPLGYKLPNANASTVFAEIWELRNSSQAVAYISANQVAWLEPSI